jgi:hypothetical protein
MAAPDMEEREVLRNTPTGPVYKAVIPRQRMPKGYRPARVVKERFPRHALTTQGTVAPDGDACVYVAGTRDGRLKIGMSARRENRMVRLAARLVFAIEVVRDAAKEVETQALRLLGNQRGDGEYVSNASPEQAIAAVREAYRIVGAYRHVDPAITAETAKQERIRRANA